MPQLDPETLINRTVELNLQILQLYYIYITNIYTLTIDFPGLTRPGSELKQIWSEFPRAAEALPGEVGVRTYPQLY